MRTFVAQSVSLAALLRLAVLNFGADVEAAYMPAGSALTPDMGGGLIPELPEADDRRPESPNHPQRQEARWAMLSLGVDCGSAGTGSAPAPLSGPGGPAGLIATAEMPPSVLVIRFRTVPSPSDPPDPMLSSIFEPPRTSPLL